MDNCGGRGGGEGGNATYGIRMDASPPPILSSIPLALSLCLSPFRGWCDTQSQGPERGGCPRRRRRRAEAAAIVVRLFGGGVGREKEQKIAEDKKKEGEEEGERRKKKNCFRTLGHYSLPLPCLFIAFISRKKN